MIFFVDFCAKGYPNLMPNQSMLLGRTKYKNFYIPSPYVEAPFIMQRRIFKGDFSERHLHIFRDLYARNKNDVLSGFENVFGEILARDFIELIDSGDLSNFKSNQNNYIQELKKVSSNNTSLSYRAKYSAMQLVRAFYRVLFPVGLNVAFINNSTLSGKNIEKEFLDVMAGSFHGELVHNLNEHISTSGFLKFIVRKNWDRITKKISIITFDGRITKLQRLILMLVRCDIIFTHQQSKGKINTANQCLFNNDCVLDDFVSKAISTQALKTRKQFGKLFSPTAKYKS